MLINYNGCDGDGDGDSANLSTRFLLYPFTFYVRVVLGAPQSFSNMIVRCNGRLLTEIVARGRRDESTPFVREGDASAHGRWARFPCTPIGTAINLVYVFAACIRNGIGTLMPAQGK